MAKGLTWVGTLIDKVSYWIEEIGWLMFWVLDSLAAIYTRLHDVWIKQEVQTSTENEKSDNLGPNETWYGGGETTLGCAGIQVNFACSNICEVEVQQSNDFTNWDVRDSWIVSPDVGTGKSKHGRTVQATGSYFRIKLTNLEVQATTYLRLSVTLCPIVEAIPRSLTSDGNLKISIEENRVAISKRGGQDKIWTENDRTHELLERILGEMRLMNYYLDSISDNGITDADRTYLRRMK